MMTLKSAKTNLIKQNDELDYEIWHIQFEK